MRTPENIKLLVAEYFNCKVQDLEAKTRKREIVVVRHFAMFYIKSQTALSLKSIGMLFGKRDHSTVIHALTAIKDGIDCKDKFTVKHKNILDLVFDEAEREHEVNMEMKPFLNYQFDHPLPHLTSLNPS